MRKEKTKTKLHLINFLQLGTGPICLWRETPILHNKGKIIEHLGKENIHIHIYNTTEARETTQEEGVRNKPVI